MDLRAGTVAHNANCWESAIDDARAMEQAPGPSLAAHEHAGQQVKAAWSACFLLRPVHWVSMQKNTFSELLPAVWSRARLEI